MTAAAAADPPLTVPASKLAASLHCQAAVRHAKSTPVMLVTGTGLNGKEAWTDGFQASLTTARIPTCYVDFPEHTSADVQVAAQYLVSGLREMRRRAGRTVAVYGISQGGLLPRYALTYWPSLRPLVSDAVLVAGTQHGTTTFQGLVDSCATSCSFTAAVWQQAAGSNLLAALNATPDETPGSVAYTTIRTTTDEVVKPQTGAHPTSALKGATNISIQSVCSGRETTHIGSSVDSVSYAALADAITHSGPASTKRLPHDVCLHPYAPHMDEAKAKAAIDAKLVLASQRSLNAADGGHKQPSEPALAKYARNGS